MLLSKIKVIGRSMDPTIKNNQLILASSIPFCFRKPKVGEVVVLKKNKFIIKRITRINKDRFFVEGDNKKESTDSRNFGWISKSEIVGKMILKI